MSCTSHRFAANRFVEGTNGVRYAYRRFGNSYGTPLLFLQHHGGCLDDWDPTFTDAVASEREVILVDGAGVGLSGGAAPCSVQAMVSDLCHFIRALDLKVFDVLGFCLGGFVAQELALRWPDKVRKLVLAATGPQGGPDMHGWRKDVAEAALKSATTVSDLLYVLFKPTETSQAQGRAYIARTQTRVADRDVPVTRSARDAQYEAIVAWGVPEHSKLLRLAGIQQPTFAATGDADLVTPPRLTHLLGALIPAAEVKIYPDAAHGFLFQDAVEVASDVNGFLDT